MVNPCTFRSPRTTGLNTEWHVVLLSQTLGAGFSVAAVEGAALLHRPRLSRARSCWKELAAGHVGLRVCEENHSFSWASPTKSSSSVWETKQKHKMPCAPNC